MAATIGSLLIHISADTQHLVKGLNKAEKSVKKFTRNAKQMIGGLALGAGLAKLTKLGFDYNSQIETTTQSIGSLLAATSKLQDQNGQAISQQQLYNTAMAESTGIMAELQRINSQTPMGLNETAQIYKTMLPSMRAVGVSSMELIELTKNLAVATGISGVKTGQLLSQVDNLATGTVAVNSEFGRWLKSMGLSNDMLNKTKDKVGLLNSVLGKLKGELTMDMALNNLQEAWSSTWAMMTKWLWKYVKQWTIGITNYLNEFKAGLKLIPYTYKAMMDTIYQMWSVGIAKLAVVWEQFLLDMKTKFTEIFSWAGAELGIAASSGLLIAQDNLRYANTLSKSFGENLLASSSAMDKIKDSSKTVAQDVSLIGGATDTATGSAKKLKTAWVEVSDEVKTTYTKTEEYMMESANIMADGMNTMFVDWQNGALDWKDTMKSVLNQVAAELFNTLVVAQALQAVTGMFGTTTGVNFNAFAKGGVQDNGVQAFASGGIVNGPTAFPMKSGTGLMGEAGPEAIMPVTRTSNGDLGVKSLPSPINVQVSNYGNDNVQVSQNGDTLDIVIAAITQDISRGTGTIGTAIEGRYGLSKR